MAFDELVPTTSTHEVQAAAMARSMRWAKRSRDAFDRRRRACRARGAVRHPAGRARRDAARRESADALIEIGFDGYAVGGLAVGEGQAAMFGCLDFAPGQLPADKPRYLMGVGKPDDIVGAVERGIDMFDCVLPTRIGPDGAGVHARPGRSTSATPSSPRIAGRSIRPAPARSARPGRAPISTISSAPARFSARC